MKAFELGFPGPLRDSLVAAVLDGRKTTTTGLLADYEHEREPLPRPGERAALLDSGGNAVAVVQTVDTRTCRLSEVDLQHAVDEGEGYSTLAAWRAEHERFWHSEDMRAALHDPGFVTGDDTVVVLQRFRLMPAAGR